MASLSPRRERASCRAPCQESASTWSDSFSVAPSDVTSTSQRMLALPFHGEMAEQCPPNLYQGALRTVNGRYVLGFTGAWSNPKPDPITRPSGHRQGGA